MSVSPVIAAPGAGAPLLDREMIARQAFMDKFKFFGSTDRLETILWQLDPELNPHYKCENGTIILEKGQFPIDLKKLIEDIQTMLDQANSEPSKSLIINEECRKHILVMKKIIIKIIEIYKAATKDHYYEGRDILTANSISKNMFFIFNVIPRTKFTTLAAQIPFSKAKTSQLPSILTFIKYNLPLYLEPRKVSQVKIHCCIDPQAIGGIRLAANHETRSSNSRIVLNDQAWKQIIQQATTIVIHTLQAVPSLRNFPPGILPLITSYTPITGEGM